MKMLFSIFLVVALSGCVHENNEPDLSQRNKAVSETTKIDSLKAQEAFSSPLSNHSDDVCKNEYYECESSSECCDEMVCERAGAYPSKVCIVKRKLQISFSFLSAASS